MRLKFWLDLSRMAGRADPVTNRSVGQGLTDDQGRHFGAQAELLALHMGWLELINEVSDGEPKKETSENVDLLACKVVQAQGPR